MYCFFSEMCGNLGYIDRSIMQYSVNAKQFQSRNVEVVVGKTTYGRMWSRASVVFEGLL